MSIGLLKNTIILVVLIANLSGGLMPSQAATIQVNTSSASSGCSLDKAIASANDNLAVGGCLSGEVGRDIITFAPSLYPVYVANSLYVISNQGSGSFSVTPEITSEIEVVGPDSQPGLLTLELGPDPVGGTRAFTIAPNGKLSLKNLSMRNFTRNRTNTGGTIRVAGELVLDNVEITGSSANFGGAIWVQSGSAIIRNSVIWGNTAQNQGGGIGLSSNSIVSIFDSTISNNQAIERGGGIALAASPNSHLSIINSTISENHSDGDGGGISLFFAATTQKSTVNIKNSILSGNTAILSDDVHFINSDESGEQDIRFNVLGSKSSNYLSSTNNLIFLRAENNNIVTAGVSSGIPLRSILGPLKNNGGKTLTHALVDNSPAIDTAIPFTTSGSFPILFLESGCRNASTLFGIGSYRTDQRGVARPIGNECDIGAYEYEEPDEACYVIKAKNSNVITFCL